jgi:hypothetical protein
VSSSLVGGAAVRRLIAPAAPGPALTTLLPVGLLLALVAGLLAAPVTALRPVAAYSDVAATELLTPALGQPAAGVLEAYLRGPDGAVTLQVQQDGRAWSTQRDLGGRIASKPAVISRSATRTDLFARGTDGQLWQRYRAGAGWSPWIPLGGGLASAPAVTSSAPGRLDVFVRGTDGQLYTRWHAGAGWSPWARLHGGLASAPSATSTAPGRLDVVVRGTDGQAYRRTAVAGSWGPWTRLGGVLSSEPGVAADRGGTLHVLVRGTDGLMYHGTVPPGGAWSGWARVAGALRSGPGVVADGAGLAVAARDAGGRLLTRTWSAARGWSPWAVADPLVAFRGLGAWVDLFDYEVAGAVLQPGPALDDMRARGVRTLYLQTSRFSMGFDMASRAAQWVDGAHARGMRVVGWYLPGYGDMPRDLRRTLAIAQLRTPAGGGFDAVGVDIEAHTGWGSANEVPRTTMNVRAVEHLRAVRSRTSLPLAAITPQPVATDDRGETWEGFPWQGVGATSDAVVPMSYWPRTCRDRCVYDYTLTNARYAGSWSGLPVHVVGRGFPSPDGTQVSDADLRAFVDGALAARPIGGSIYDYESTRTRTSWWPQQQRLNSL